MLKLVRESTKTQYFQSSLCELAAAASRTAIFANSEFRNDIINKQLEALHTEYPIRHVTLDVFDTVVLRNEKAESRRFWEIAGHVANTARDTDNTKNISQEDVFVARIMATRASYRTRRPTKGCREGSLSDIYRGMVDSLGLAPELVPSLIDSELDYEVANTTKNPLIDDIIAFCKPRRIGISMISDMYMSATQIEHIVDAHFGTSRKQLGKLVSSCDEIISKRSGHLFDLVAEREGLAPSDFVHVGDSIQGDFKSPIQRGWRAILIPLTRNEINTIKHDHNVFERELEDRHLHVGNWIKSGV